MNRLLALLTLVVAASNAFGAEQSWVKVPAASAFDGGPFVQGGIGAWKSEFSGKLGTFNTKVNDLGLSDESNRYFYLEYEHNAPMVPHVRLEHTNISSSGTGTLSGSYSIRNQTFSANTTVKTDLDISFNDLVLYYKKAPIDFGIVLRQFDTDAAATSTNLGTNVSDSGSVSGVLPMAFLRSRIDLPLTGLHAAVDAKFISYDEKSVTDYRATFGYGMKLFGAAQLGLEAGYRSLGIDLGDDEQYTGDLELSGAYLGLTIKNRF